MQNLRDKLLKAGLVSEAQSKASTERPARKPAAVSGGAPIPKLPPLPGSPEYQRQLSKRQAEQDRAVREKVLAHQVEMEPGPRAFHFVTRKQRLRRLELSEAQAEALESGRLAVVERPEPSGIEHALVPAEVADALAALSPKAVRFLNREGSAIGFLSDEELESRAHEVDAPDEAAGSGGVSA